MGSDYYTWQPVHSAELLTSYEVTIRGLQAKVTALEEEIAALKECLAAAEEAAEQAGYEYQNLLERT